VTRQADGNVLLVTRLTTSSQTHLYARIVSGRTEILKRYSRFMLPLRGVGTTRSVQALAIDAGGIPVRLRFTGKRLARGAIVKLLVTAVDPYGRRGTYTLSFKAP
jgi:hypothetical protein